MTTLGSNSCRTSVLLLLCLLVAPVGAFAGDDGGYPGNQLQWGVGARAVAMGSAFTAIAEGATGFAWNPAGISQGREDRLESAWRTKSFDRQAGYVAYVHPFGREEAAMGLSWVYAGESNLYERSLDGTRGDKLSNFTNAAAFTFARRFTRVLSVGLNLRYVQQDIANVDAYTVGFDIGAHFRFVRDWRVGNMTVPMSKVRMGIAVQQLNQKYPWTTGEYWVKQGETGSSYDEKFPLVIRAGVAANVWKDRALVSVDGEFSDKLDERIHAGVEVIPVTNFALRAGLDHDQPTLGAGWALPIEQALLLNLDYAFATQRDTIDPEHVFSLGLRF